MDANFFLSVFCITVLLGLISLGFQIYVSRRLRQAGAQIGLPLGKRSWITPFIEGWKHAKALEIQDVMAFWSFVIVLTFIGMFMTVIALLAAAPAA